ncbi:MAG: DEAD/DEAH box helicase [Myxococcota bacterium]
MNSKNAPAEPTEAELAPTFDKLPLTSEVRRAVNELGWLHPTPVQIETYPPAVAGTDLVVQARTGTGKTGAFGLPLVDKIVEPRNEPQALLLAPTRELALQSARELESLAAYRNLKILALYGGAPMDRQIRELKKGPQILSGTPGRVLDHILRGTLNVETIRVLVLDEADEMLSMGFARELNAILDQLPRSKQTLLFSATVDDDVQRMAQRHMNDPQFIMLSGNDIGAASILHFTYSISGLGRARDLVRILEVEDPESAIIFCNTKMETEKVASELKSSGFTSDWLNGDLPQSEREKVMARTRSGEIRYLVATDVAARGIDVSHLTHVINYMLPEAPAQYIHRTGRTGRAGRTGTAISLVSPRELGALYYIRLQYKIFPAERSLPSEGEAQTRIEMDRICMLTQAFPNQPSELDAALARRLQTHRDAERILGGLLSAFFGEAEDVDEVAAAARRARVEPACGDDAETRSEEHQEPKEILDKETVSREKLFLNLGRRDGLRPQALGRFVEEHTGITRAQIRSIRIKDTHSFFEVPRELADDVVGALRGRLYAKRNVEIDYARSE